VRAAEARLEAAICSGDSEATESARAGLASLEQRREALAIEEDRLVPISVLINALFVVFGALHELTDAFALPLVTCKYLMFVEVILADVGMHACTHLGP
jgi:hypothetical protein